MNGFCRAFATDYMYVKVSSFQVMQNNHIASVTFYKPKIQSQPTQPMSLSPPQLQTKDSVS